MSELPDSKNSQKKVSQSYSGNLRYFSKPHYLRSIRFWCVSLTIVAAIACAVLYPQWKGGTKVYSTGPISENHAALANNCKACHSGADQSIQDLLKPDASGGILSKADLAGMDNACVQCHPGTGVHAPQLAGLLESSKGVHAASVHAVACASCHREHVGDQRIAPPGKQVCTDCHGNAERLAGSVAPGYTKSSTKTANVAGVNADLGDGLLRYIAPDARTAESKASDLVPVFESFAKGHPSFGYERPGAQDPADLKFNHARHFRSDIPLVDGKKLDCASCHQLEPNRAFYQPVRYEKHCQQCHTLQIQSDMPDLKIPHGDSAKVRLFLGSLDASYTELYRAKGVTDPVELSKKVEAETQKLRMRGLLSLQDLEQRVFFDGDPKDDASEKRLMRSGNPKFLTECSKCHTVAPAIGEIGPKVNPPQMARRWLQKGQFTHLSHTHMECKSCHGDAEKSKLTSDILLPTQKSCVECHYPSTDTDTKGVKSSCLSCHQFHSAVKSPESGPGHLKAVKPSSPSPAQKP